jgi:hypothetical protein
MMDRVTFDRLSKASADAHDAIGAHFQALYRETLTAGVLSVREGGPMDDKWRARYRELKAAENAADAALFGAFRA